MTAERGMFGSGSTDAVCIVRDLPVILIILKREMKTTDPWTGAPGLLFSKKPSNSQDTAIIP